MPRRASAASFLVLLLAVACGGGSEPPPAPARQPTPLDLATTGVIAGAVRLDGAPPPRQEVRFGSFAECKAQHPQPTLADDVLVVDGRVQNAFVYLQQGLGDRVFAIPAEPVTIDQKGCLYTPRVAGAQVGQLIKFVNSDPAIHNVHGVPKESRAWNFVLARAGLSREIRIDHPEVMVSIRCDLHPWMQGWIGVVDHPYYAVTGADGAFRLAQVPPGTYTVAAWHERLGTRSQQVTIAERAQADVTLAFGGP
jgi:plastocyanin